MLKKRIVLYIFYFAVLAFSLPLAYAEFCGEKFNTFSDCDTASGTPIVSPLECPTNTIICTTPDIFDPITSLCSNPDQIYYNSHRDDCCRTNYFIQYDTFCKDAGGNAITGPAPFSDAFCLNGIPYSTTPTSTQPCACTRGTQYKPIIDACGTIAQAFDPTCLTIPTVDTVDPLRIVAFTPCSNDLASCIVVPPPNMTDFTGVPGPFECRDVAAQQGHFTRVCADLEKLQTFVTATAQAACQGLNVFPGLNPDVGCLLLPAQPPELNESKRCLEDQLCRDGACVPVDCTFLRQDLILPMKASIDYPHSSSPAFPTAQYIPFHAELQDNAVSYQWDFKDGSPMGSGMETSHAFASPGTYTVTLTVFDKYACIRQDSVDVTVVPVTPSPAVPTPPSTSIVLYEPQQDVVYATTQLQLRYSADTEPCSYQLNDGSFATIVENPGAITAREGANHITVQCGDQRVERDFQVILTKTPVVEAPTILSDFKAGESIITTPDEIDKLIAAIYAQGEVTVIKIGEIEGGRTRLTLRVRNDKLLPLADVRLRVTFPKTIVLNADGIQGTGFAIIEPDPVIEYGFGKLATGEQKEAIVHVSRPLSQADLGTIATSVAHQPDSGAADAIRQKQSLMEQFAEVHRRVTEFLKDGITFSKVTTTIKPKGKGLKDVRYYQDIPKCLAQHIDELEFRNKDLVKVLNPDPLIMWHFEDIESEVDMSYDVKGVIDAECIKQIKDLALAEALGLDIKQDRTPRLLLTLLTVPMLAFVIIYFGKFKGKLKREEAESVEGETKAKREEIEHVFEEQIMKAERQMKKALK